MYVNYEKLSQQLSTFKYATPFNYCVIDNFFELDVAKSLSREFPCYESSSWHVYENQIENKKTSNNWNLFPSLTYRVFRHLCSNEFVEYLSGNIGETLYSDIGLHGGGWHIHADGGNLNPHLDYSIHPKLSLQRKLNLIVYISEDITEGMGGDFGMWSDNNHSPGELVRSVVPLFNRAVIFDTTQNSWHGMSSPLVCPPDVYRKSLAVYYLCDVSKDADKHKKALFAPRENQKGDVSVEKLIKKRSDSMLAESVYRDK